MFAARNFLATGGGHGATLRAAAERSLRLLRVSLLASALILAIGGVVLSSLTTQALARIVAKFGRLREAVPVIRHHHEPWDGVGYPDWLSGDEILIEALIAGIADAWDAMTTDRPYHRALTAREAFVQLRAGRGKQFAPPVVDAFFAAIAGRPADFGLDEPAEARRAG